MSQSSGSRSASSASASESSSVSSSASSVSEEAVVPSAPPADPSVMTLADLSTTTTTTTQAPPPYPGMEPPSQDMYAALSTTALGLDDAANKIMTRIYLPDDSYKTVFINPERETIADVWRMVCERAQLPPSEWEAFFIWAVSADVELLLDASKTVAEVVGEFPSLREQFSAPSGFHVPGHSTFDTAKTMLTRTPSSYQLSASKVVISSDTVTFQDMPSSSTQTGMSLQTTLSRRTGAQFLSQTDQNNLEILASAVSVASERASVPKSKTLLQRLRQQKEAPLNTKLVFRTTQMLLPSIERRVQSPAGIRLLFIQALHDVKCSNYPMKPGHAARLAALALQANVGDFDPSKFKEYSVSSLLPEHLKSINASRWEAAVLENHKKLAGMDSNAAMLQFVEICRKHPAYGSTFFPVTFVPHVMTSFKQQYEGDVILAVNAIGIHIIDSSLARSPDGKPIKMCPFQRILSWDSDKLTFFCEFLPMHGPSELYTFKTPHGNLINDLVCDWLEEYRKCAEAMAQARFQKQQAQAAPPV